MTVNIMTLKMATPSILYANINVMLSVAIQSLSWCCYAESHNVEFYCAECHYAECHCAEFRYAEFIMLSVIMLNVIMLSAIMLFSLC